MLYKNDMNVTGLLTQKKNNNDRQVMAETLFLKWEKENWKKAREQAKQDVRSEFTTALSLLRQDFNAKHERIMELLANPTVKEPDFGPLLSEIKAIAVRVNNLEKVFRTQSGKQIIRQEIVNKPIPAFSLRPIRDENGLTVDIIARPLDGD